MGSKEDVMKILHINNKKPHLVFSEKFHICKELKKGTQINDKYKYISSHCNIWSY
jgi:hypothetical protein